MSTDIFVHSLPKEGVEGVERPPFQSDVVVVGLLVAPGFGVLRNLIV